jgi:hypothetical protein
MWANMVSKFKQNKLVKVQFGITLKIKSLKLKPKETSSSIMFQVTG